MKLDFNLVEKKFKSEDGRELKYYVLTRNLIDGSILEIPLKGDKSKLLMLSLAVEKNK